MDFNVKLTNKDIPAVRAGISADRLSMDCEKWPREYRLDVKKEKKSGVLFAIYFQFSKEYVKF